MAPEGGAGAAAPGAAATERSVRALFFAYFGFVGSHSPYLSLFFAAAGFTVAQIGLLMAVPQAMRILAPPVWGLLADRARHGGRLLVLSACLTTLSVALLPWAAASGYAATMVLLAAMFFSSAGITPIAEATAVALADGDTGRYGRIRSWGSIGFVLAVVALGPTLDAVGVERLPWFLVAVASGIVLVGLTLSGTPGPSRTIVAASMRERLREPRIAAFFVASFLMLFAHAALYVLFSLFLARHGYSKAAIGLFWAVSVVAEIVLFRLQRRLFARYRSGTLLSFSIATAAVRFALVAASGGLWWVLLGTQLLHAVTFGLHHSATMSLLHRWFEPSRQARAQALYVTIGYGCGGTLGGLAMSAVWEKISPEAAFLGAAFAAAVGSMAARYSARADARMSRVEAPEGGIR